MNSIVENQLASRKPVIADVTRRPQLDLSLLFGIAMLTLLALLFALEFSRILTQARTVNDNPAAPNEKLVSASHQSSSVNLNETGTAKSISSETR